MHNDSRISEKTKENVRQVAKKLQYQPNHLASALRSGKSNLVGVIVPRTNSNFFSSVIQNIEEVLNKKGYSIIITQSNESYDKECKSIDTLLYTQVDGIIASMANETIDLSSYEKIKSKGIPLILFDRGENDLNVDYIGIDDLSVAISGLKSGCRLYSQPAISDAPAALRARNAQKTLSCRRSDTLRITAGIPRSSKTVRHREGLIHVPF